MTNNTKDCHPNDVGNNYQALDGLRILVVDDDADSQTLVSFLLESVNVKVMTASSVIEALEVIGQFKPNLLISDIAIPVVDGYTLIRKVRTLDSPLGKIPAIAVTAVDTEEERNLALKYGFQAYLIKPIEPDELMLLIAKFVEIRPKTQQSSQKSSEITSNSEAKQVDKLPIQTKFKNKDFANQIIARSKELRANSKQLKIRYNDLGCRFVAMKAYFAQTRQKMGLIKLYQKV